MNGKSVHVDPPLSRRGRSVQDEWGLFDPNQAGLEAVFRAARALAPEVDNNVPGPVVARHRAEAPVNKTAEPSVPIAARASAATGAATPSPISDRVLQPVVRNNPKVDRAAPAATTSDNAYNLTEHEPALRRTTALDRGAVYTLEFPTQCPRCASEIETVRVSRLLRTQVSFTSTLPRKGYLIVCPNCEGILSAELSGLI